MLKIDDNLLQQIGLGALPTEDKRGLLTHIYETLEMRVGMRLADQMSNEQLDEFETYFEAKDDAGAFKWLETNFPNYKDIVNEEFEKLKGEVQQAAPQILAAAQANPAQPAAQPQVAPVAQQPQANAAQPAAYPPTPVTDTLQTQGQDAQAQTWPQQGGMPAAAPADPYAQSQQPAPQQFQPQAAPASQTAPWDTPAPTTPNPVQQPMTQPWTPEPTPATQPPVTPTEAPLEQAIPSQPPQAPQAPQQPQPYQPMPPAWTPDQPNQNQ